MKKTDLQKQIIKMLKNEDFDGLNKATEAFQEDMKIIDFNSFSVNPEDSVTIMANDYYQLICFVLKRMKIKKFKAISFGIDQYGSIEITVNTGKEEFDLNFDAYVHHNDEDQTEMRMEIESLWSRQSVPKVIETLKNTDWSDYLK